MGFMLATTHPLQQYEWVQRLGLQAEIDRIVEGGTTDERVILNESDSCLSMLRCSRACSAPMGRCG